LKNKTRKISIEKNFYFKVYFYQNKIKRSRNAEIETSLQIIRKETKRNCLIEKDENGKPSINIYSKKIKSISISHNSNMIGVLFSDKKRCGFDIENISERIEKLKEKFCSEKELNNWKDLKHLTLIWTFKEAIYKYYSEEKLNFKNEILILNIDSRGIAKAKVNLKNKKSRVVFLGFKLMDKTIISYVKNEYPTKNLYQ
jgi:phosphopantetheinyl transferase (holo-ACP synthase)